MNFIITCILILVYICLISSCSEIDILYANKVLTKELTIDTLSTSLYYQIQDILPETSYEIRISYIGAQNINYKLALVSENDASHRELLDIEKISFSTDEYNNINGIIDPLLLKITPIYNQEDIQHLGQQKIIYSVVVEQLYIMILPQRILPLIYIIIILFILLILSINIYKNKIHMKKLF